MGQSVEVVVSELDSAAARLDDAAQRLRDGLSGVDDETTQLLGSGWKGGAASAYAPAWEKWHDGAKQVVEGLQRMSELLTIAGKEYAKTDESASGALGTTVQGAGGASAGGGGAGTSGAGASAAASGAGDAGAASGADAAAQTTSGNAGAVPSASSAPVGQAAMQPMTQAGQAAAGTSQQIGEAVAGFVRQAAELATAVVEQSEAAASLGDQSAGPAPVELPPAVPDEPTRPVEQPRSREV
ncbi:WXG100 family type VII secretion target [Mycolicibacterium arabiense]|uniref:WXG100 family type VII secretion target n=1 Tax=Mycolicibacterium arabiense TaxID=1286181 RepID=UPI0013D66D8D|nr:WXG100 family type VII secretion target [Mycolicibacterium arabiense]MCV7373683.1 WXG100 family type VII secretion target [Mycolicibacterium arabiense]